MVKLYIIVIFVVGVDCLVVIGFIVGDCVLDVFVDYWGYFGIGFGVYLYYGFVGWGYYDVGDG